MKEYELYLDESGQFTEGLPSKDRRAFPSQVVGVLGPRGILRKEAEKILEEAFVPQGKILPERIHAKDLSWGPDFDALVIRLVDAIARRPQLQAVRLENREDLGFGNIEATYTRMIAELCIRLMEHIAREQEGEIGLHLVGAIYMVKGEVQLSEDAYRQRLQEHFAFAAVRRGLAAESARFKLLSMRTGSGQTWRELQVCDVLSNASHANYKKLGDEPKDKLRHAFQPLDWSLTVRDLDRRLDDLLDDGYFGLALQSLAEELIGEELSPSARKAAKERLPGVLDALAALTAPARTPQLAVLDAWLDQLDEHRRDPDMGHRVAQWLLKNVDAPLRDRLGERATTMDPFTLVLLRHSITASNHRGALVDARAACEAFNALMPSLAGRWELGPVVIEGLIAESVHMTDRFEYEEAIRLASSVASYYRDLSSLLAVALPGVFPKEVRSEQRGKALGTQLQAEMYAGLKDPARFDVARTLNDEAAHEFSTPADVARQMQVRSQIETLSGKCEASREYLAKSLGVEATHDAIAGAITKLPSIPQGFALIHWWRLGAAVLANGDDPDREAFSAAFRKSKLHESLWCNDEGLPYPAHGIRRYQALIACRRGEYSDAESVLGKLRQLQHCERGRPLMALIVVAAHLEVAGLLWRPDSHAARRILSKNEQGAQAMLHKVRPHVQDFPKLRGWVDDALVKIRAVLSNEMGEKEVVHQLQESARLVAY